MMSLKMYYGKKVNVVCQNGRSFRGVVSDYFFPDDNESNEESIAIETNGGDIYEFTKDDISEIAVI